MYDYFNLNYKLHREGWSLTELDTMTPFERTIYQQLYINDLKERRRNKEET
ncbi:hypothetical protein AHP1_3001 [Aeromonas phage Ahp1_CNU-2021]|nr:hypothetical protein AHP1_3001 [Aeromonas phage Ahp1_CNU-2021]